MPAINLFCFYNAWLLISVEENYSSNLVSDCCKPNRLSNYFIIYISNHHDLRQVFQIRTFQLWEYFITGLCEGATWYTKFLNNLSICWLDHNSYFIDSLDITFRVWMVFNQWETEMISDPSGYMFLIVGFYHSSVTSFL